MQTTLGKLRALLREAIREDGTVMWGSKKDLDHSISAMDPKTLATHDYVDEDTGEIYLEKGQPAEKSVLHPDHVAPVNRWSLPDESDEVEEEVDDFDQRDSARREFEDAIKEFAANSASYTMDNSDVDPMDVASDMAESFFHQFPQWKMWAQVLSMTRQDIKSAASEAAYEVMISQ